MRAQGRQQGSTRADREGKERVREARDQRVSAQRSLEQGTQTLNKKKKRPEIHTREYT